MGSLTFAYTEPATGTKSDECLSFTIGLPDYQVLYEEVMGYGVDDKPVGTRSGLTVTAVIRVNEVDYTTTVTTTEAWKALYNYKGTLTVSPIGHTPQTWQLMRLVGIEEEKHGPVNKYLTLTFRRMAA